MDRKKDKIVNSFVRVVRKEYPSSKICLFGSRAKGTAKKNSDYDFIVISKDFKRIDFPKRCSNLYFLKRNIPAPMDILCYTPEEFELKKSQIGIIQEALKEGIWFN